MTRYFLRLPAFDTVQAALDATAHLSLKSPAWLHECHSGEIVGCVELCANAAEELERRARELMEGT